MWTLDFWKAVAERAISTAAQAAVGVLVSVVSVGEIDWRVVGSTVLIATLLSVLKNIAAAGITDGSPSLNGAEVLPAEPKRAVVEVTPKPWPTSVVHDENGIITTHYSDGTQTTEPGV